ncbi:hypothetical protein DFH27DRAFT_191066 [Peziza echinospora]|nr:hypothetical protein DFH27DRAFT_191066 [Peziza echinospora]
MLHMAKIMIQRPCFVIVLMLVKADMNAAVVANVAAIEGADPASEGKHIPTQTQIMIVTWRGRHGGHGGESPGQSKRERVCYLSVLSELASCFCTFIVHLHLVAGVSGRGLGLITMGPLRTALSVVVRLMHTKGKLTLNFLCSRPKMKMQPLLHLL